MFFSKKRFCKLSNDIFPLHEWVSYISNDICSFHWFMCIIQNDIFSLHECGSNISIYICSFHWFMCIIQNDIFSLHECDSNISIYIYSFHRCGYHISIDNNPFHLLSGNLLIYRKQSRRWNVLQSGRLSPDNVLLRIRFTRRNSVSTRSKSFWTDYLPLCKAQNWK